MKSRGTQSMLCVNNAVLSEAQAHTVSALRESASCIGLVACDNTHSLCQLLPLL